jgi:hypothetical protein
MSVDIIIKIIMFIVKMSVDEIIVNRLTVD